MKKPKQINEATAVVAMAIKYIWFVTWDYTFYKWGFVSTYNWYFGP